ncbi:unnamed protein product [Allacma fusca]|uniref:Uncharacterized protein n=1 Tax=Allacma fusca TaxID=39272 RepID=A0A8J2J7R6_9HEXA|nr:unnamed protein product [Allacma fusca]
MLVLGIVLLSGSKLPIPRSGDNITERISAVSNSKIDPCQDFSRFACTRIVPETTGANETVMKSTMDENTRIMLHEIKSVLEEPRIDDESEVITMTRQLFNECRMYNSSNYYSDLKWLPFFTDDKPIIEWPITEEQWNQSETSLERILALVFTHGGEGIFDIKVALDKEDGSRILLIFRRGIENNLSDDDIFEHYEKLSQSVQALNEEKRELSPSEGEGEIFKFKNKFDKLMKGSKCDSDKFEVWGGKKKFVKVNLDYIQSQIPQINWIALVQNIFEILELEEPEINVVYFPCFQFFYELGNLIEETGRRTVSNYLIFRFFVDFKLQYLALENSPYEHPSRGTHCAKIVNDGLKGAVAHLYQKKYPIKSADKIVQRMMYYLKIAFRQMVSKQTWIPVEGMDQVKNELIEKLLHMKTTIGFSELISNATSVDELYYDLELYENSFILNILKIKKFQLAFTLMLLSGEHPVVELHLDILGVGAYYIPSTNKIMIPYGSLISPIFHKDYPMYLNFANLGFILAHEIVHGFDNVGIQYDKHGLFGSSWPKEFQMAFTNQAICLVEQYEKFRIPLIDRFVDGYLTLGENICDNAAVPLTLLAYEMWAKDHIDEVQEPLLPGSNFTIPQIFYIAFGQMWCQISNKAISQIQAQDVHSPGPLRVKGVIQNDPKFGQTFGCPIGTPMNPTQHD